eukprot:7234550-Pyramimonas_sp.AAC.1
MRLRRALPEGSFRPALHQDGLPAPRALDEYSSLQRSRLENMAVDGVDKLGAYNIDVFNDEAS